MNTIKWGQRCIARRFETVEGVAYWESSKDRIVGNECIVTRFNHNGSVVIDVNVSSFGETFTWLASALEPIPETPSIWWPGKGDRVMHDGKVKTVAYIDTNASTHKLDNGEWVNVLKLTPVTTTEITPEEAVAILEQHTGKLFTIKSK
jgi:hypothetical protein